MIIFGFSDGENRLILTFEKDTHKPISLEYRCDIDWKYEAQSRSLLRFKERKWIPTTLNEFYSEDSQEIIQFGSLIMDIDVLYQSIFK